MLVERERADRGLTRYQREEVPVKTLWLMAVLAVTLALPAWGFLGDKEPDLVKRFGKPISRTGNTLAWNQDGLVIRATLDAGG